MRVGRFRIDREAARAWLTGGVVLVGLMWVISWLLDTQQIGGESVDDEVAATTTVTTTTAATPVSGLAPVPLSDLLPLGPEDDGFRVTIRGTVVAEPTRSGFWVLTDEDEVLFVRTVRPAASGQDLELTGTLRQWPSAEGKARAEEAKLREAAGWKVHDTLFLDADPSPVGGPAAPTGGLPRDTS